MNRRAVLILGCIALAGCTSTGPPTDTTPPTLLATNPSEGAAGVALDMTLRLEFSEPMQKSSVSLSATPTVMLSVATWPAPSVALVEAVSGWPPAAEVSVTITGNDASGNALATGTGVSFATTVPSETDETPPAAPTNLAATARDGGFDLTWDANQEDDLLGYLVFWGTDQQAPSGFQAVAAPQNDLVVNGLSNGAPYFVTVMAEDVNANRSQPTTATVTPADVTPPALVASLPVDGATGLATVSVLRFEFSEPVLRTSFALQGCEVAEVGVDAPCGTPVSASFGEPAWSAGDATAQLNVAGAFAQGAAYRVTVEASDLAGNGLVTTDIEFALAVGVDDIPPEVLGMSSSVSSGLNRLEATFMFSEAMDPGSVQDAFESQPSLACSWTWIDPQTARCRVTSGLQQLTDYVIVFGVDAADAAGNTLEVPWSTSIAVGDLAPRLVKVTPGYDAFNVNVTAPITLTFTEALDPASLTFTVVKNSNSTAVPGSVYFETDNKTFTYTPSQSYGYSEFVFWYVTTLKDAAGTSIPDPLSGSFRTRLQAGQ